MFALLCSPVPPQVQLPEPLPHQTSPTPWTSTAAAEVVSVSKRNRFHGAGPLLFPPSLCRSRATRERPSWFFQPGSSGFPPRPAGLPPPVQKLRQGVRVRPQHDSPPPQVRRVLQPQLPILRQAVPPPRPLRRPPLVQPQRRGRPASPSAAAALGRWG